MDLRQRNTRNLLRCRCDGARCFAQRTLLEIASLQFRGELAFRRFNVAIGF